MILQLIKSHEKSYPGHTSFDRLQQLGMTASDYWHLQHDVRERAARESAIPQADVDATVQFIIKHPDVGAGRAHLTLIDQELALVSTAFINDARQETARLAEETYRLRNEQEKQIEADLRARRQASQNYQHIQATYPHHIWATDFVVVRFLSFQLIVGIVYDVYSQAYLAIQAGSGCDHELAQRAITAAIAVAGIRAGLILRRDNGKAFLVESYQSTLTNHGIQDAPIPPGQPWFNGSLESNNSSLKTAIKTTAMQQLITTPSRFHDGRQQVHNAVELLQQTCNRARTTLNDEIARPKFAMPPGQVLTGKVDVTRERHALFVEQKKQERTQRMETLRETTDRPDQGKTFLEKVTGAAQRLFKKMTTDQLYVFNEISHHRYQAIET